MVDDTDEEEMEDVEFGDKRKRHWRMFFDDNDGGVGDKTTLLYAKRWDVYLNEN